MWNIIREHMSTVAITAPSDVSLFAVDSLKQLSVKFLLREEIASIEFQREFLIPFQTIFMKVEKDEIKELVLNCCNYIVSHVLKSLKSGWKIIIEILLYSIES
mmetsp:Transcript_36471/g.32732  ORF Transcript_36471/g.32732 Transcript_36471/m.32732 type:complete len:103 (-) Transcript_36471:233-541(-)